MNAITQTPSETDWLGVRLAHAIANGDADALTGLLHPDVDFRAVTPGRCWESHDARSVVGDIILGTWFSAPRRITAVVDVQTNRIGPLDQVRYRFEATLPDGPHVVEQQAYLSADDGRIASLSITC